MSESATLEIASDLKELGDKIAGLTLKEAKSLSDYLEQEHGIKAAAGPRALQLFPGHADELRVLGIVLADCGPC